MALKKAIDNSTENLLGHQRWRYARIANAQLQASYRNKPLYGARVYCIGQRVKSFSLEALVNGNGLQLRDERAPEGTTGPNHHWLLNASCVSPR